MHEIAHTRTLMAGTVAPGEASPFITVRLLRRLAVLIDTFPWVAFVITTAGCGWIRLSGFPFHFLDHDELFTYYIAQAPTLRRLLELTHTVDLHPPLSYLLVRASLAVFGHTQWACRLPSVLAFFAATALLFWLVTRLVTPMYGLIAILLIWNVPITYSAGEARPYSLMLFSASLLLVFWYRCIANPDSESTKAQRTPWRIAAVTLSSFGLLLSHVLGLLCFAAFLAAECVRWALRGNSDWRLWRALLVPLVSVLAYVPLFHTSAVILFTDKYRATPLRIAGFYWEFLRFVPVPLAAILLLAIFWPRSQADLEPRTDPEKTGQCSPSVFWPSACLLGCLALIPLVVGAVFAYKGMAFFDRYGVVFFIPYCLIPALLLGHRARRNPFAGMIVVLLLLASLIFNTIGKGWLIEKMSAFVPPRIGAGLMYALALPLIYVPSNPLVPPHLGAELSAAKQIEDLDSIEPSLPVVANTGLSFLELDHQGSPALVRRLYLLQDKDAAIAIAKDTVFENYDRLIGVFPLRGSIRPYCPFTSEHPRFLAIGAYNHPQGWVLKRLDAEQAQMRILGTYTKTTEEAQVYEVTVTGSHCQPDSVRP